MEEKKSEKKRKSSRKRSKKSKRRAPPKPTFPAAEIHFLLSRGKYKNAVKPEVSLYISAAEEYLATEILEKAGNHAITNGKGTIDVEDVIRSIKEDEELNALLGDYLDDAVAVKRRR